MITCMLKVSGIDMRTSHVLALISLDLIENEAEMYGALDDEENTKKDIHKGWFDIFFMLAFNEE